MIDTSHKWNTSLKPLFWGFAVSIVLTLLAYSITTGQLFGYLALSISGLCIMQALVQLVLFLHLGAETRPRWNLMVFLFMVLIIVVVIGGSLWIMYNLNYNVMPDMQALSP